MWSNQIAKGSWLLIVYNRALIAINNLLLHNFMRLLFDPTIIVLLYIDFLCVRCNILVKLCVLILFCFYLLTLCWQSKQKMIFITQRSLFLMLFLKSTDVEI